MTEHETLAFHMYGTLELVPHRVVRMNGSKFGATQNPLRSRYGFG